MTYEKLSTPLPRLGILGASRIVRAALMEEAAGFVEVAAIAARDWQRAEAFAREHDIPKAYGSYQELIDDPTIDLIYNALPASGHVPWSSAALRSKKHVLCEKPFALDTQEAEACVALAQAEGRLLMEAHHWRYHPLTSAAEEALLGLSSLHNPVHIEATFVGGLNNPGDIRLSPLLGPGVLMDYGCYTIQWCDWAAGCIFSGARRQPEQPRKGENPSRPFLLNSQIKEGEPGVDLAADVTLGFEPLPHGEAEFPALTAHFTCDMQDNTPFRAFVRVTCGDTVVHFENPLNVRGSFLTVEQAGKKTLLEPSGLTTYGGQLRAFLGALSTGEPPITSGANIIRSQALLDECYRMGGLLTRKELREQALEKP